MSFLECVFGPRLYVDYKNQLEKFYNPGPLEKLGDQIISTVSILYNVGYYVSPILGTFVYRRGYLTNDSGYTLLKFGASIVTILVISLCLRGVGRLKSPTYVRFIKALSVSKKTKCSNSTLSYDFDFREWNVDFDMSSTLSAKLTFENDVQMEKSANSSVPCKLLAYVSMHTFGLSMIYPGSVKLLQKYMRPMLLSGRSSLIKNFHARRYKLKTIDKNEIDSCFVDNREKKGNGEILVICSEGNAGFYEIGIMSTPLSQNYSVLGWNHPGFAGSTGKPVPDQERNAIYCIMTFAINHLGFTENNILLYGWSIGAYTTLYAASSFKNIKGVILDATFDDILYLARNRMPESLTSIVNVAIRSYCNLNNLDLITRVNAPILLIRRTEDEIIAEENCINSNRGNFLAMHLLTHRYPNIFKGAQLERIRTILSKPIEEKEKSVVSENCLLKNLKAMKHQNGNSFPLLFGGDLKEESRTEIAEFLLYKHLLDFASTHCTPLPAEYFNIPWDLSNID